MTAFNKEYTVVICVLLTLGTVLQLVGFATPGWEINEYDGLSQSNGLWYGITCWKEGCKTLTYYHQHQQHLRDRIPDVDYVRQVGYQVIATLSVVAAMVSCVLSSITTATRERAVILTFFSIVFTLVSAALIWSVIGVIAGITITLAQTSPLTEYHFPYSLFLSAIGSLLCLACSLAQIVKMAGILRSVKQPYQSLISKLLLLLLTMPRTESLISHDEDDHARTPFFSEDRSFTALKVHRTTSPLEIDPHPDDFVDDVNNDFASDNFHRDDVDSDSHQYWHTENDVTENDVTNDDYEEEYSDGHEHGTELLTLSNYINDMICARCRRLMRYNCMERFCEYI